MTIGTRLTLWYAGILFTSILLIAGLSYREATVERQKQSIQERQEEEHEGWDETTKLAVICGIPAALLGLGGGWLLTRKALNPVNNLTIAATRVNERNLHEQLPRTGNGDELDRLTQVLNDMTKRLGGSFTRIRDFTLHASHELKTPLTVLHGQLETVLREATLTTPQRDLMLNQLDELQRLSKIVDGLTLLTKADAGQVALKMESIRLDELVRDAVADAKILAQSGNIQVRLMACDAVTIHGDRHRLRQLLLNLTDNAVKYNYPDGTVDISLVAIGKWGELKISNTGDGIPQASLTKVFDPFFRVDESHSNFTEGSGLGLSICQWIVTAHGGTIQITSDTKKETLVLTRFPMG